jgi:NitT/TauT family transport system permease protein
LALLAIGAKGTFAPLEAVQTAPISLDPAMLPFYVVRTVLRMLAAMVASLLFTLTYGTLAAKSRRAEIILIPILDVLQSVPILGYISFTVVFFMNLFPGRVLGAEFASIFAVFTSQAWNMAFSFYQSLRTIPHDLDEASRAFRFSSWQRFWRLEAPFAVPGLVWNMMMSMSGGWFFVVASEAISVGNEQIALPGIGSYVALAIEQQNLGAIGWALGAMTVVILLYDQLMFRPFRLGRPFPVRASCRANLAAFLVLECRAAWTVPANGGPPPRLCDEAGAACANSQHHGSGSARD